MRFLIIPALLVSILTALVPVGPSWAVDLLDDDFVLPEGFHIYRYYDHQDFDTAYSVAFDGKARLYLGDGSNILRVLDTDGDEVADATERIAEGLGERGPQGLLFLEEKIFANGADAQWILEDLDENGIPQSRRRIGGPVKTGGDRHAHDFVRGHDGYVYWMAGNDSEFSPEGHITEKNSPIRKPLGATVFRIGPDGAKWEAISTGCGNPFDIGINYLGEIMTVDSDDEGQIGLPYYRPVRLTNYVTGGRMGWLSSGDGKLLPYQIDNLPGLHDVGRGSPTGILFYEHSQFPEKYRDALFMGDYMNKRYENLQYATTGQILVFHLERSGAAWKVRQENFAKPRSDSGMGPKFAVIDMTIAPDGSLLLTTQSDGVLRIYYDPEGAGPKPLSEITGVASNASATTQILSFPQPGQAWALPRIQSLTEKVDLAAIALDSNRPTRERLRAIRFLAPDFKELETSLLQSLCKDPDPEVKAQAVWLVGLRAQPQEGGLARALLQDDDSLVQRRAAAALGRLGKEESYQELMPLLTKKDRWVRYAAMSALSHRDPNLWAREVLLNRNNRLKIAIVVAVSWTEDFESTSPVIRFFYNTAIREVWEQTESLMAAGPAISTTPLLEVIRVSQICLDKMEKKTLVAIASKLPMVLSHPNSDVLRESSRLAGRMKLPLAVPILAGRLPNIANPVLQLHVADQLTAIDNGWTPQAEERTTRWFDASDEGWHGDRRGKGTRYPGWWRRIVTTYIDKHTDSVMEGLAEFNLTGPFGKAALEKAEQVGAPEGVDLALLWDRRNLRLETRRRELPTAQERNLRTNQEVREFVLSSAVEAGMTELGGDLFNNLCLTCHEKGSAGSRRGPNLDAIRAAAPEFLIDSILQPNLKVDEQYRSRHVTLENGDIVKGTLVEETSGTITLAGEGEPVKIGRSDIDRITITDTSVMPENLLNARTWNEIRDLWAFLRSEKENE